MRCKRYFAAAAPRDAAWAVYFLAGGKPRQVVPSARALARSACDARRHRRLAVRRVLPGGRRPRRDHRATCCRRRRTTATSAWPSGSRSACCRCAACRPRSRRARVAALLGRARHAGPLPAQQADRRRLSRRRQQAAGAARAGRGRRRRRQAGRAADDGLHRRRASRRAPERYLQLTAGDDAGPLDARPAVSVLPRPPARRAAGGVRRAAGGAGSDWLVEWKYDGIRAQVVKRAGAGLDLVARRGTGDRALPRDRRRWPQALPDGTVLDGEIVVWKDERGRAVRPAAAAHRPQDADEEGAGRRAGQLHRLRPAGAGRQRPARACRSASGARGSRRCSPATGAPALAGRDRARPGPSSPRCARSRARAASRASCSSTATARYGTGRRKQDDLPAAPGGSGRSTR